MLNINKTTDEPRRDKVICSGGVAPKNLNPRTFLSLATAVAEGNWNHFSCSHESDVSLFCRLSSSLWLIRTYFNNKTPY